MASLMIALFSIGFPPVSALVSVRREGLVIAGRYPRTGGVVRGRRGGGGRGLRGAGLDVVMPGSSAMVRVMVMMMGMVVSVMVGPMMLGPAGMPADRSSTSSMVGARWSRVG